MPSQVSIRTLLDRRTLVSLWLATVELIRVIWKVEGKMDQTTGGWDAKATVSKWPCHDSDWYSMNNGDTPIRYSHPEIKSYSRKHIQKAMPTFWTNDNCWWPGRGRRSRRCISAEWFIKNVPRRFFYQKVDSSNLFFSLPKIDLSLILPPRRIGDPESGLVGYAHAKTLGPANFPAAGDRGDCVLQDNKEEMKYSYNNLFQAWKLLPRL